MILKPIIPIPLMIIISIIAIVLAVLTSKKLNLVNRILIVIVLFAVSIRPMIPNGNVNVMHNNFDIIFVVDTTISMNAEDYNGSKTRLSGVKNDVSYIMEKIPGAYYALIGYSDSSQIRVPLTNDTNAIEASIETVQVPDQYTALGSTITDFKPELTTILNSSLKKEDRIRIVFVFTDGENTSKNQMADLSDLKDSIDNGAVLGYGTEKGGYMSIEDYYGKKSRLQDKSNYPYVDAVSKIDEDNLEKIADEMGIEYIHMTKTSNIDSKIKKILKTKTKMDEDTEKAYQDIYFYYAPILVVLFIIELSLDRRSEM